MIKKWLFYPLSLDLASKFEENFKQAATWGLNFPNENALKSPRKIGNAFLTGHLDFLESISIQYSIFSFGLACPRRPVRPWSPDVGFTQLTKFMDLTLNWTFQQKYNSNNFTYVLIQNHFKFFVSLFWCVSKITRKNKKYAIKIRNQFLLSWYSL